MTQETTAPERTGFTGSDITTDFVLDLAETADQCELDYGDPIGETLRLLVAERDALQSQLDAARRVKPLEWDDRPKGVACDDAEYVDTTRLYCISECVLFIGHAETGIPFGTLKEAKAAAQADYERRILSALQGGDT